MQDKHAKLKSWQLLCIALITLGVIFRFVNIDKKIYWHDEVLTSLQTAGYSRSEFVENLFVNREVSLDELQTYQKINPDRGLSDLIYKQATEDPPHTPFYFLMLQGWLKTVGESITTTRLLSAVFSLLVFPALYWLSIELFASPVAAWISIALLSISPFHVLYAQEAREYSLWMATTLGSSAAFLRAMRLQTRKSWLLYSLTLAISLYVFIFSGLVAIGHGIYALCNGGVQRSQTGRFKLAPEFVNFLISALYGLLAYMPWIMAFMLNFQTFYTLSIGKSSWATQPTSFPDLIEIWAFNFSRVFIDFNSFSKDPSAYFFIAPILILEGLAAYWVCRHAPRKIWLFLVTFMGSVALPIALADFILGGQRSIATRYLVPLELGLLLLVAYFFVQVFRAENRLRRTIAQVGFAALLIIGILSCGMMSQAQAWWNKSINYFYPQMAEVVNRSGDRPVIITDSYDRNAANTIVLSYLLDPKVRFVLLPEIKDVQAIQYPAGLEQYSSIFFLSMPQEFLQGFAQRYNVKVDPVISELAQAHR